MFHRWMVPARRIVTELASSAEEVKKAEEIDQPLEDWMLLFLSKEVSFHLHSNRAADAVLAEKSRKAAVQEHRRAEARKAAEFAEAQKKFFSKAKSKSRSKRPRW